MIRILYLIDNLDQPTAGTEKQLMRTVALLDRRRFECTLMTLSASPWLVEETNRSFAWENLESGPLLRPGMLSVARRFAQVCRRREIDLVHTYFVDSSVIGPLWAKLAAVPVVVSSRRNIGYHHTRTGLWALRFVRQFTTHVIANSKAAASAAVTLEHFDPTRISVIPNMLDLGAFTRPSDDALEGIKASWGFPKDAVVVGAVANLRPVKNLELLVRAAATIAPRFPAARFVVLGEGPERSHLQRCVDATGLGHVFALPGTSVNIHRDIFAFDIGSLVSNSESSPNALLEYMAAGKASVVSDVGGVKEIATHERTALIFPKDDLNALVRNLERLLCDLDLRAQIGRQARQYVHAVHDQAMVIRTLEDLYVRLVESSRKVSHSHRPG